MLVDLGTDKRLVYSGLLDITPHEDLVFGPGVLVEACPEQASFQFTDLELTELFISIVLVRKNDGTMLNICRKAYTYACGGLEDDENLMFDAPEPKFMFRDDDD